ncbi:MULTISPECIES: glycosyltransferase family 4 protein [unclassified Rickettsia]|uniref:glycosyltransferase family 4 protein n=1 Tax=unclassified Rickettsia TaxID=114295 RepID=UPI00209F5ADA|nr:glycosyltransferase family 4 protein [Rickettsia endosymbiont of Ceutorhynchus assimilis]
MKILNIMLSRDLGGIQQAFLDYSSALRLQKVEVINVTSFRAKINAFLPSKNFILGYKLPNLAPIDFFSSLILKYIIYKTKPNIIIAHGNRAINFSKFAKSKHIKLIGIAHNYSLKGLKKCDYVIALTKHMKKHLLTHNFTDSKIFLLPNMINIKKDFIPHKLYTNPIVIGMIARLVPKKGANVFIEAMHILREKRYEFKAIIGGNGEEAKKLLSLTDKLGLKDYILFTGWVKDKDKFFAGLDIFCLPSLHEPFGIILLEAMEASLPIVSSNTEGPSEILTHMQEGLLCENASSEDLAEKIMYLIDHPNKAQKFSQTAYLKLKENYDINIVSKKLVAFCESI